MSQNFREDAYHSGVELPTDLELARLISDAVQDGSTARARNAVNSRDPAREILDTLETKVETDARAFARHEIDTIASEIQWARQAATPLVSAQTGMKPATAENTSPVPLSLEKIAAPDQPLAKLPARNPFAPVPESRPPVTWLVDAAKAKQAREASATWERMASFTGQGASMIEPDHVDMPSVEDAAEAAAPQPEPEPVFTQREEAVQTPSLNGEFSLFARHQEHTAQHHKNEIWEENEAVEAVPAAATVAAAATGQNGWFGHSQEGLPLWMTAGIPVAAVSVFALGFAMMGGSGSGGGGVPGEASTNALAVAAVVPVLQDGSAVDDTAEPSVSSDAASQDDLTGIEAAGLGRPQGPAIRRVAATGDTLGAIGTSVVTSPSVSDALDPFQTPLNAGRLAPAPSLKPAQLGAAARRQFSAAAAPSAVTPRQKLPVRIFTGPIDPGSAAEIVNAVAQQSGPDLNRAEQFWLARDMERVLENEIDGRSVSLKSRQGQRVRVTLKTSRQEEREYVFKRARELAALPEHMVLEGGWYAARRDINLHSSPTLNAALSHRTLKQGDLIERMATYTDPYGDRWYLMGQRGLAVGFINAGDVALAATYKRKMGPPYAASHGKTVNETRRVYTKCREGFIGAEGDLSQKVDFCRNADAHWVKSDHGKVTTRYSNVNGHLLSQRTGTATAIVLAEATGDPLTYHAFGNRMFRRRLQNSLTHARFGQTTEQVLPDGDRIKFTFGERYEKDDLTPIVRVKALGAITGKFRTEAGWMKAPIGASLRAMPDLLSEASLGEVPAGRALETMGRVEGLRGEDWMLVGRSGVGFGYIAADKLAPIEGRVSPYAIANLRPSKTSTDLVEAVTTCRTVSYETVAGIGRFAACQKADGSWAIEQEPDGRSLFAGRKEDLQSAP